ncbi:MAG TPA: hypothetical protein VMJ13_01615 [Candidatus Acidoferrum sp.]|nr:hypothetical protein [Candidatus Acidoferrum sp.]
MSSSRPIALSEELKWRMDRVQRVGSICGVAGLALLILFSFHNADTRTQFFRSYLFAFVFWLVIPLGCQAILMMHHLTGGWWGYPIRRLLEAGTRTVAVMAILFLPLLAGVSSLYDWAKPAVVAADPLLRYKRPYLNPGFFTVRAVIYFVIWIGLAWALNKWSREQDETGDPSIENRFEALSGPGLILWGIAITFAAIDWVMSLEPHWFSTIYGMIFMIISALTGMSFVIFVESRLSEHEPLRESVTPAQYNDQGNLMLAFVMLWAYLSYSQFLIIWSGNLKEEIPWYITRAFGGWGAVAVILMVLHFGVPFLLLLQRSVKRKLARLSLVAGLLIVLSLCDMYWLIVPAFQPKGPGIHAMDVLAVLGIGGIWLAAYFWQLKKMPLLPLRDPRFAGELEHQHGD